MVPFKLIYTPFPGAETLSVPEDKCLAFCAQDERGYHIFIDSNGTEAQKAFALRHELAHIVLGHLEKTKPLAQIDTYGDDMFGSGWLDREDEADQYALCMTDKQLSRLMKFCTGTEVVEGGN